MTIFDVSLYEPIHPGWTADATTVTADSVVYTADGSPLIPAIETNDAAVNANIITADIFEPVARVWTADSTVVTADSNYWTADGGPLEGARDVSDADVVAAELPVAGGGYYRPRKPVPVIGYGYGILPQLWGEGHGTVGVGADAFATLSIVGAAAGAAGAVGDAAGVCKNLLVAGAGVAGTHGSASGVIMCKLNAAAIGRFDDDEAAVMTFLLAA